MSVLNFEEDQLLEVMGPNESVSVLFTPVQNAFVDYIRLRVFHTDKVGDLKLELFQGAVLKATSTVSLSDNPDATPWFGMMKFTFNKEPLTNGLQYSLVASTVGCTDEAVSFCYDIGNTNIYEDPAPSLLNTALAIEIYHLEV